MLLFFSLFFLNPSRIFVNLACPNWRHLHTKLVYLISFIVRCILLQLLYIYQSCISQNLVWWLEIHKPVVIIPPRHTDVHFVLRTHLHYFLFREFNQISTVYCPTLSIKLFMEFYFFERAVFIICGALLVIILKTSSSGPVVLYHTSLLRMYSVVVVVSGICCLSCNFFFFPWRNRGSTFVFSYFWLFPAFH